MCGASQTCRTLREAEALVPDRLAWGLAGESEGAQGVDIGCAEWCAEVGDIQRAVGPCTAVEDHLDLAVSPV
jgi:hypothetical protein